MAGSILLGEVASHLTTFAIARSFCSRVGKANVARLLSEHGPLMSIPTLLRLLSANCPRRLAARISEPCGAHLPALPKFFRP